MSQAYRLELIAVESFWGYPDYNQLDAGSEATVPYPPLETAGASTQSSWQVNIDWDRDGNWDGTGTLYSDRLLVPDDQSRQATRNWDWAQQFDYLEYMLALNGPDASDASGGFIGAGELDGGGSSSIQQAAADWASTIIVNNLGLINQDHQAWIANLTSILTQLYVLAHTNPSFVFDGPGADDRTTQQLFDDVSKGTIKLTTNSVQGGAFTSQNPGTAVYSTNTPIIFLPG